MMHKEQLTEMLTSIGLKKDVDFFEDENEVSLTPARGPWEQDPNARQHPGLTGDHWCGTSFYFNENGSLKSIEISE